MQAIESLLQRRGDQIDYILLETTGLADPFPIIDSFWADEALECLAHLDGVVVLIDGKNFEANAAEYDVLCRQVVLADVIIINKLDLIDLATLLALESRLRKLNPLARILHTKHSQVPDFSLLLGLQAYGAVDCTFAERKESLLELFNSISFASKSGPVSSIKIKALQAVNRDKLERWLFSLLWERKLLTFENHEPINVLRAKGLLPVQNGKDVLIQAVQDLYDISELSETPESSLGLLVLLGLFASEQEVIDSFHSSVY